MPKPKPNRLSAAGRKAISSAARRRWNAFRYYRAANMRRRARKALGRKLAAKS